MSAIAEPGTGWLESWSAGAVRAAVRALDTALAAGRAAHAELTAAHARRRALRGLRSLNDHTLRDIGLNRNLMVAVELGADPHAARHDIGW